MGRLPLPESPDFFVPVQRAAHGITALAIDEESALHVAKLPDPHGDPFDRLLVAQVLVGGLVLLSPDESTPRAPSGEAHRPRRLVPGAGEHDRLRPMNRLAVVMIVGALSIGAAAQEPPFVPLFDGTSLKGWVNINCAPDTFGVRDGMITSTGVPICEIRTDRMYENFVLELEYMHQKPMGNAGVFIWADALPARGQPFLRAIEVQVLDGRNSETYTSHGDVFAIHGAVLTPDRPHPNGSMRSLPSERRAKGPGEWNHYRITANKGTIKLAVNGKEVSGGYDISPRKGYIALESEGAPTLFRNIRIRELPSAGTLPPAQIATADEGHKALYDGKTLSGWIVPADRALLWKATDWTLTHEAGHHRSPDAAALGRDVRRRRGDRRLALGGRGRACRDAAGCRCLRPHAPRRPCRRDTATRRRHAGGRQVESRRPAHRRQPAHAVGQRDGRDRQRRAGRAARQGTHRAGARRARRWSSPTSSSSRCPDQAWTRGPVGCVSRRRGIHAGARPQDDNAMRTLLTALILACLTAVAGAESPADGTWKFTMSSPMGAVDATVALKAEGEKLTGTFDLGGGRV